MRLMPDFIIAGAGRAGTTSLYGYLDQHPEICMSRPKEISFFSHYYSQGLDWYARCFRHCGDHMVVGEASQNEMISADAPARMHEFNKNFRLIFIMRDPVNRMFSDYKRHIQVQGIRESFSEIIRDLEHRTDYRDVYIEKSLYYKHVSRFREFFPISQFHFVIFERFLEDEQRELKAICRFLGVDDNFRFDRNAIERNISRIPLSRGLQRAISYLQSKTEFGDPFYKRLLFRGLTKPVSVLNHMVQVGEWPRLLPEERKQLIDRHFATDIALLEKLLGTELPAWKKV